jgi:hypothetical protein
MSFNQEISHEWIAPEQLPRTIQKIFEKGACVVFADEVFTAAIPCTNKQANELASLFESAAVALDDDFTGALKDYFKFRDELCAPKGYQMLSLLFKQEMEKEKAAEESRSKSKYCNLASAYRPKDHELN